MKLVWGFTLVEILVTFAILSFIMGGIFAVFNVADMSWNQDTGTLWLQQQARQAMDGMIREIRQAKKEAGRPVTITAGNETLAFYIPGISNPVSYYLENNQIVREHPAGTKKILANDIGNLSFCCWHNGVCDAVCSNFNIIEIKLTATKTVRQRPLSFNLTEEVRLRNE